MSYDTLIPSIPIIISYLISYTCYKKNLIKKRLHINIWNLAMLLTFIVSGLGGFLFWHVEFGITMLFVGLFHLHTYWKSTKKMLNPVGG